LPGGRLFVAVPNAYAASRQIAVAMGLISSDRGDRGRNAARASANPLHGDAAKRQAAGLQILDIGGILFKPLANFQFDRVLKDGIVGDDYLNGCYELGKRYPELCASIYVICGASDHRE
jgi:hypothetical protein